MVPFFNKLIREEATELTITDERMTRFIITLSQGVDFVLKAFQRMQQGELFVPKIPSIRIVDLAEAMAPQLPTKIVGIRPGEKLHEVMCPADDSSRTLEFDDHFVITPSINFLSPVDYGHNALGEQGVPVCADFEYSSDKNPVFLDKEEIKSLLKAK